MTRKPINYKEIEKSNVLVLNYDKPIRITFLDDGFIDDQEITDDKTGKTKLVDKYIYEVIDLNESNLESNHKELSFLAKTFPLELSKFLPVKNKSFMISKREGMDKFDVKFKIVPIKD